MWEGLQRPDLRRTASFAKATACRGGRFHIQKALAKTEFHKRFEFCHPLTPRLVSFQAKCRNVICISNTSFHLLGLCHEAQGIFALYFIADGRVRLGTRTRFARTGFSGASTGTPSATGRFHKTDPAAGSCCCRTRWTNAPKRPGPEKFGANYDDSSRAR